MNDDIKIQKILKNFKHNEINEENISELIDCFYNENFFFTYTSVEEFNNKIKNTIDFKEYLPFDFLIYSPEELKEILIQEGYYEQKGKDSFPSLY